MSALIIGWGNPIAGDDGVGWRAAEHVRDRLRGAGDVEVVATARGAFSVAERALGHDHVVVLDAALGEDRDGVIRDEIRPRATAAGDEPVRHDGSLRDAIRALCRLDASGLPERIVLLSWPIPAPTGWRDGLSKTTSEAAARLAEAALDELERIAVA